MAKGQMGVNLFKVQGRVKFLDVVKGDSGVGSNETALFDVTLAVALGKATFKWGIMVVGSGFHKMKAATIREVTRDVWGDLPVPDGLTRGGSSGLMQGCIAKNMDSLNRFGLLASLLRTVPLLDGLKFEGNREKATVFGGQARMRLDRFAKMGTVGVGESAQKPTTDGNLGGLDWVNH